MRSQSKPMIVIEFGTPEELLEWWEELLGCVHLPDGAELYEADALDMGGRASPHTYVVRSTGDRGEQHAARNVIGRPRQRRRRASTAPHQHENRGDHTA